MPEHEHQGSSSQKEAFTFPPQEIVTKRAGNIIGGIEQGLSSKTLNPEAVKIIIQDTPRENADILSVAMGLKPASSFLSYGVAAASTFYERGFNLKDYIKTISSATDIPLLSADENHWVNDVMILWSPDAVTRIFDNNRDLLEGYSPDPFDATDFAGFMEQIAGADYPPSFSDEVLHGVVLGIPRSQAEHYARVIASLLMTLDEVKHVGSVVKPSTFSTEGYDTLFYSVKHDKNGMKDKVLSFIQEVGISAEDDVLEYIHKIRPASVPGFEYASDGEEITPFEKDYTGLWEKSDIDNLLMNLLKNY